MITKRFIFIIIGIGVVFFLSLPAQARESAKSEKVIGFNHENPVAYTKDGKKIGNLNELIVSADLILEKNIQETSPRRLVAITFEDNEFIPGRATPDRWLWFRRNNLKLTISEQAPCPELSSLQPDMTTPVTSGIGCR